jgi:hypothetical protein
MRKQLIAIAFFVGATFSIAHNENIYFSEAVYYDNDADGFIDSIVLTHTGPIIERDITTLRQTSSSLHGEIFTRLSDSSSAKIKWCFW